MDLAKGGGLKTASHEAAGEAKPEAYLERYVEDFAKPRTT